MVHLVRIGFCGVLLSMVLATFVACDPENAFNTVVEIDLPDFEDALVINSIITDDLPIAVALNKAQGTLNVANNDADVNVPNAQIQLFANEVFVEDLTEDAASGKYVSTTLPVAGIRYKLVANAEGYEEVSAETVLPVAVSNVEIEVSEPAPSNDPYEGGDITVNIAFDDIPEEDNYYYISMRLASVWDYGEVFEYSVCFSSNSQDFVDSGNGGLEDVLYTDTDGTSFCNDNNLLTDALASNNRISLDIKIDYWVYNEVTNINNYAPGQASLAVEIGAVNRDFYLYQISTLSQWNNGDNPFTEPTNVYGNTSNGMGIFAAYSAQRHVVIQ